MKKKIIIAAILLVVVVLVVLNVTRDKESGTPVRAAEVEQRDIVEIVSASGSVQPQTKVNITSQINGEVVDLRVREGDRVEKGQLLIVLDTVQLRSDLDRAEYQLEETKARLAGAKASLEQAEDEYQRQKQLFDRGLTSETAYKDANWAYLNAEATHNALNAQVKQLQAAYEKQLDNLQKAKIVAPMSGIITFLDTEVGEIAAAQTAFTQGKTLMTISNLDVFEVEVEVDETEIAKVDLHQKATIELDAFPDTTFQGEVVEIGNTAITGGLNSTDQSTNFRVKVIFHESGAKVRPGMSATVDITTATLSNATAVPFAAVVMREINPDSVKTPGRDMNEEEAAQQGGGVQAAEGDGDSVTDKSGEEEEKLEEVRGVFVISNGEGHFRPVTTGIADQKYIAITSGIQPGDTVISGPYRVLRSIKDGDAVRITRTRDEEE